MIQKIVNTVDWDDWSDSTKHANSKIENNETMTKEKKQMKMMITNVIIKQKHYIRKII